MFFGMVLVWLWYGFGKVVVLLIGMVLPWGWHCLTMVLAVVLDYSYAWFCYGFMHDVAKVNYVEHNATSTREAPEWGRSIIFAKPSYRHTPAANKPPFPPIKSPREKHIAR